MKTLLPFIGLVLFFLFQQVPGACQGQSSNIDTVYVRNSFKGWSVNLNAGSNLFYGDIRVYGLYPVDKPRTERQYAFGALVQKKLNPYAGLRLQFLTGNLSGVKRTYGGGAPANKFFEADIVEFSFQPILDFNGLIKSGMEDWRLHMQGFAGAGLLRFRSKLYNYRYDTIIGLIGYSKIGQVKKKTRQTWVIPLGLVATYYLNHHFSLSAEFTYRITGTDEIDITKGKASHDGYGYTSLGMSYHFSPLKVKKKRPERPPEPLDAEHYRLAEPLVPVINEAPREKHEERVVPLTKETPEEASAADPSMAEPKPKEKQREKEKQKKDGNETSLAEAPSTPIGHGFLPLVPKAPETQASLPPPAELEYRVQVLATYMQRVPLENLAEKYKLKEKPKEYYNNGWYQYSVGSFSSMDEAQRYKKKLAMENELEDAFVVMFKNGTRFFSKQRSKVVNFNVVTSEDVVFPKPDLDEEQEFENVEFRVQVGAISDKRLSPTDVKNRYKLLDEVKIDSNRGIYYYSVGSFRNLRQAREYCKVLISNYFIYDAFVISYIDGVRKTLMEMTTNIQPESKRDVPVREGVVFRIQLLALKDRKVPLTYFREKYKIKESVMEEMRGDVFVYMVGNFHNYKKASDAAKALKELGITDAFIVAYSKSGKRIPLKEAFIEF